MAFVPPVDCESGHESPALKSSAAQLRAAVAIEESCSIALTIVAPSIRTSSYVVSSAAPARPTASSSSRRKPR
ncbi:hypothetical protein RSal33209_2364 [Renibacterium salmoninarum ATCC 33209]|uniref:Uncharacterized protein n=1 Tax=Renibacterium salmoninarum (strain ATCC 33209 / DSM 20767 / JCM 11484 / NBRC 15589 / NCIMB 2235) TaxID=288705 RepID=A9WR81_RENSM|nr:hypothetical protein RSal33209_2364 [Renibacterium salmoninarum ATCC 33209]